MVISWQQDPTALVFSNSIRVYMHDVCTHGSDISNSEKFPIWNIEGWVDFFLLEFYFGVYSPD